LNLIKKVTALVVANEMRADVLADALGRPGFALEATEKSPCNILCEVDARILIDHFLPQRFWKCS
jgi:hypothetical protein